MHQCLNFDDLHPLIADAAEEAWGRKDFPAALQSAWFALRDLARQRLNQPNLDGTQLFERIGDTTPTLPLTEMATDTQRDMHRGVWRFLVGVAFYIRNPEMHQTESPIAGDRIGAFERLAVMSICARHLEAASSPVAVDEAVLEASQALFPATQEAADDLVHSVPTGRRAELVEKMMDAVEQAVGAGESEKASNLRVVYRRALHRLGAEDPAVRTAATRCGRWIASDATLAIGMGMLNQILFGLLERRHQAKVALTLRNDVMSGSIYRGTVSGSSFLDETIELFGALPALDRELLVQVLVGKLGGNWDVQAYGTRLACALSDQFGADETTRVASALARALLEDNPFDASDELARAFDDLDEAMATALHKDLTSQYRPNAPGAHMARNVLIRFGTEVEESS